jgi:predicted type IV restriction endonuclease
VRRTGRALGIKKEEREQKKIMEKQRQHRKIENSFKPHSWLSESGWEERKKSQGESDGSGHRFAIIAAR